MTRHRIALVGALALAGLMTASALASDYEITDLEAPRECTYLIVAADAFAQHCDELLRHRAAQGHSVGLVALSTIIAHADGAPPVPEALVDALRHARNAWQTQYVLLVGDAVGGAGATIPMRRERASYYSTKFLSEPELATDYHYGTLGGDEIAIHVGRLPVDTPGELAALIAKTVGYETSLAAGPWQRKVSFIAGTSGFGTLTDSVIQAQFTQIAAKDIPASYDVEIAHAQANSPYCPFPPSFSGNALRMLNEGSLYYVYVGHGTRTGCDDLKWQGRTYPILDMSSLQHIAVTRGLPIMVIIACHTGFLDAPEGDSIAEELLRLPAGPVAVLASTRVCQPYGNALLGKGLALSAFSDEHETLGQVVDAAKAAVLAPDPSPFRQQADTFAAMLQGPDAPTRMRADVVRHYNLLGDPALRVRRPSANLTLQANLEQPRRFTVSGQAPIAQGRALITLEVPRGTAQSGQQTTAAESGDVAATMQARYQAANNTVRVRVEVHVTDYGFAASLPVPHALPPGSYTVKALVWSQVGAAAGAAHVDIAL